MDVQGKHFILPLYVLDFVPTFIKLSFFFGRLFIYVHLHSPKVCTNVFIHVLVSPKIS